MNRFSCRAIDRIFSAFCILSLQNILSMPTEQPESRLRTFGQLEEEFRKGLSDNETGSAELGFNELNDTQMYPEESNKYFEGDIKLFPYQIEELYRSRIAPETDGTQLNPTQHGRQKRKFVRSRSLYWDSSRPIQYSFNSEHDRYSIGQIKSAIAYWEQHTCLRFEEKRRDLVDFDSSDNVIIFTAIDGCASNVGRAPFGGPQYVSLSKECLQLGVMTHEIAHALGFWHEQSRADRDQFVTVMWRNIKQGLEGQFTKELAENVDNSGLAYDYGSVMHYRGMAYSRSTFPTIRTNIPGYQQTIGQREQPSFYDVKLMNKMYCSSVCSPLNCEHGGYVDPKDCSKCLCPDGLHGRYCEEVDAGRPISCGGHIRLNNERREFIITPNYPGSVSSGQECTWKIEADRGYHVRLQFVDQFSMHCKQANDVCENYVEVVNTTDFGITGMRFCCPRPPSSPIYSQNNLLLVRWRSPGSPGRFKALLSTVQSSTVFKPWSGWSGCSANCGGCGTQIRYRSCAAETCDGSSTIQSRSCNAIPCRLCFRARDCIDICCENYWVVRGSCLFGGRG